MDIVSYLKEKAKKNLESKKRTQEAYDQGLKEITDLLNSGEALSTTPSYERYEYDSPSDEEIRKSAEDELKGYLLGNENAIKNEYAEREKELSANKESSKNLFDESSRKLKETYEATSEALSNDALKRGLARSSIALGGQIAASKAYNDSTASLVSEYNRKIGEIDDELAGLNTELAGALDSFRIDYAAKLTQRINELKSEREKNEKEAIKYNNELLEKEYKEKNSAWNQKSSKEQKADKEAYEKALYDKMNEVLSSLPIDQAKRMFSENNKLFRDNLGDVYYYALYMRFN